MTNIINNEDYDAYLKEVSVGSPLRFCVVWALLYFFASLIVDFLSGSLTGSLLFKDLAITFATSALWSTTITIASVPSMKLMIMGCRKRTLKTMELIDFEDNYTLFVHCSFKKSSFHSIGGILYIGQNKLYFKPHQLNSTALEVKWFDIAHFNIRLENQKVSLLSRLLYKYIPPCLVFEDASSGKKARFIVPHPTKVVDTITSEGLL